MKRAFTLIELLIVIAIIAILALIAIPNFLEAQTRAKVSRAHADMRSIAVAVESYFTDHNAYPMVLSANDISPGPYQTFLRSRWESGSGTWVDSCLTSLTTPIGYYSGEYPVDPFAPDKLAWTTAGGKGYDISYRWFNFQGAASARMRDKATWDAIKNGYYYWGRVVAPTPFQFNGAGGPVHNTHWALRSVGPDRSGRASEVGGDYGVAGQTAYLINEQNNYMYVVGHNEGAPCPNPDARCARLYDPTNGTVSFGDLWRLSGGTPH